MLGDEDFAQARQGELPRRRRTARAIANDEALRAAATSVIVDSGWDALTFAEVAKRAGLTVGAVYGRVETKADLGADVWTSALFPALSLGLAEQADAIAAGSPERLARVLTSWAEPSAELRAATALSIAALFDDDLRDVIAPDMTALLGQYCRPAGGRSGASCAASALSVGSAFGRVLAGAAGVQPAKSGLAAAQSEIMMALATGRAPALPRVPAIAFQRQPATEDPHLALLQLASLDVIGRIGYRRATVARICRAAQVSSGSMFARFDSKARLVVSAASTMLVAHAEHEQALREVSAVKGPAVSRAVLLRAFLDPQGQGQRALRLELARVAQHDPALQPLDLLRTPAQQSILGMGLVASYAKEVSALPFSVPLTAAGASPVPGA